MSLLIVWLSLMGSLSNLIDYLYCFVAVSISYIFASHFNLITDKLLPISSFALYLLWLLKELIISSINIIKLILCGNANSVFTRYKSKQQTAQGNIILSQSLTLTPGTITVSLDSDELIIHSLEQLSAASMHNLDQKISKIFDNLKVAY